MHVHVVFGSFRCGRRCGRHGGGGHLLSAFTAKSCVRLDLTAALGTKHNSSSLLQANSSVSRTDRELRPSSTDFAADHSIAIRSVDVDAFELAIHVAVRSACIDLER